MKKASKVYRQLFALVEAIEDSLPNGREAANALFERVYILTEETMPSSLKFTNLKHCTLQDIENAIDRDLPYIMEGKRITSYRFMNMIIRVLSESKFKMKTHKHIRLNATNALECFEKYRGLCIKDLKDMLDGFTESNDLFDYTSENCNLIGSLMVIEPNYRSPGIDNREIIIIKM